MRADHPTVGSVPAPGTVLHSDDGHSLVVAGPDVDPVEALLDLLEEEYGGDRFARDNPVVVRWSEGLTVQRWRRCSEAVCEDHGIDTDEYPNWFAPDGDLGDPIYVVSVDGSVYSIGEEADEAEEPEVASCCGCCGQVELDEDTLWCDRCRGHVGNYGRLEERTWKAMTGERCPFTPEPRP